MSLGEISSLFGFCTSVAAVGCMQVGFDLTSLRIFKAQDVFIPQIKVEGRRCNKHCSHNVAKE
jgi:hypothetical protein